MQITIYNPSTASNAGPDQDLCNVNSTILAGNTPVAGSGTWTFVSGPNTPIITTPASPNSTITGMVTGVYVFTWTITNGDCASSSSNVQVTNSLLPLIANAGPYQGSCNVTISTLAANTPVSETGAWSQVSGPNMGLSKRRASSAVLYLEKAGINRKRLIAVGYGESRPVNKCECEGRHIVACTEEEHQMNRRTEIKITSIE